MVVGDYFFFNGRMINNVLLYFVERFGKFLDDYVFIMSKVIVIRNIKREGLVRVRLKGVYVVKGEVFTFFDSYCEAIFGWVEFFMVRIVELRFNVVCLVIEVINVDTFAY